MEFVNEEIVEYKTIGGTILVPILKVKENGDLILHTRDIEHKYIKREKHSVTYNHDSVCLSKNVCVKPHRVKKL